MLVVAQVSSMNQPIWIQARLAISPDLARGRYIGRCCSAACRDFFERQPTRLQKAIDRRTTNADAAILKLGGQLIQCHVRPRYNELANQRLVPAEFVDRPHARCCQNSATERAASGIRAVVQFAAMLEML